MSEYRKHQNKTNKMKNFAELQNQLKNALLYSERKAILAEMVNVAKEHNEWIVILKHTKKEDATFTLAEKKVLDTASTLSEVLNLIENFNLTEDAVERAVKKALELSSDEELPSLEGLCRKKLLTHLFTAEQLARADKRLTDN